MQPFSRTLIAGVIAAATAVTAGHAIEDADGAAIRSTIEGQLEAFKRDDAATAYTFAAPSIQRMFPSQDIFLQMVRQGYMPVYRPKSYGFEAVKELGGGIAQSVRIVDEQGVQWLALYTMEKQPDGSWRISGCTLVKAPDQSV